VSLKFHLTRLRLAAIIRRMSGRNREEPDQCPDPIERKFDCIMAKIDDIISGQSAERAKLAALAGLITALLTAFASGQMTAAQAQSVLDEISSEDATIDTAAASIQAAITPAAPAAPPTPATPAAPATGSTSGSGD
jgi:hypothetical protein